MAEYGTKNGCVRVVTSDCLLPSTELHMLPSVF